MKPQYTQPVRNQAGKLKVVELFETVQGEGEYVGVPSVFFRTGVCNLCCPGCDTLWDAWEETPIGVCAEKIKQYRSKHVVFTGGEPTMWQDGLAELARHLPNHTITVESNGSVPIRNLELRDRVNLWSFSPKVGSLGRDEKFSRQVVLDNIADTIGHNQIKYVLDPYNAEDVERVFAFQAKVDGFDNGVCKAFPLVSEERIYFQPMDYGTEVNVYNRIMPFSDADYSHALRDLTKLVMERSGSRFRVLPQLHKYLSYR